MRRSKATLLPWERVWPRPQWDRFGGTLLLYRGWVVRRTKEGRHLTFVPRAEGPWFVGAYLCFEHEGRNLTFVPLESGHTGRRQIKFAALENWRESRLNQWHCGTLVT